MTIRWMMAALAATVLVGAGCEKSDSEPSKGPGGWANMTKSVTVEVTQPQNEDFVVWGDYPAEFVSDGMAELSSEVSGKVKVVNVRLGDTVKEGDVLGVVDPVTYATRVKELRASVNLSEASLGEARAHLANLQSELDRKKPLMARKLVTEREVEDLESQLRAAQQRVEIARATIDQNQARLSSARNSLSDTNVRAPFTGVVAERYVDVGAHVSPGQPMFRVVDDQEIYLRLRVPETESGLVQREMAVEVRVDALGGQSITGTVGRVAPAVDPATRTLRVDVVRPEGEGWDQVKPGMYARARLQLGNRPGALVLDNQAILKGSDASLYVWVVIDGKVEKRPIMTGLRGRQKTEIVDGLALGTPVVLRGIEKLRPGSEVTLVNQPEAPSDGASDTEASSK